MVVPPDSSEMQSIDDASYGKWHVVKVIACGLGSICAILSVYCFVPSSYWVIIFGSMWVGVVFLTAYDAHFRTCPRCRRHKLRDVMRGVFRDPMPNYRQYRCRACGSEFVRFDWKWIPRSEWPDNEDMWWP